jgi:cytochrome c peroxidase
MLRASSPCLRSRVRLLAPVLLGCAALLPACGPDAGGTGTDPGGGGDPVPSTPVYAPLPSAVTDALNLPNTPDNYANPSLPAHFRSAYVRASDNTPATNPTTDAGATLGRVLFYDPLLSQNRTIACASCHAQDKGFGDPAAFSTGFAGGMTGRNAMPIIDARYYRNGRFFWDQRAATLEEQVLGPIQNTVEMGMTLPEVVSRVQAQPYYPALFERAFGDSQVSSDRIAKALAQFSRSIVSYRSRFDAGLAQAGDIMPSFANFTPQENTGKALFLGRAGCAACHLDSGPPQPGTRPNQAAFFIEIATNNGLDATVDVGDDGVGDVTGRAADKGRFKSPSLRNIAVTGPYMHDGRFATLTQVVEHYNSGVQAHPNLDGRLRVPGTATVTPRRLGLTADEVQSIVAFLGTLTDNALLTDAKFGDPFKTPTRR